MSERQKRIGIGAVLIAVLVGLVMIDRDLQTPIASPIVVGLLGFFAFLEALGLAGARIPKGLVTVSCVWACAVLAVLPLSYLLHWQVAPPLLIAFVVPSALLGAAGHWIVRRARSTIEAADLEAVAYTMLAVAIAVVPAIFLTALLGLPGGLLFTFAIVLGSKLNDIGGYLVGSTIGRRKLAPGVSPNKSWEGGLAGLLFGTLGFAGLIELNAELAEAIPLSLRIFGGLALGVVTQCGDLFESACKRALGVKDSAALIPTFGGVLDIVDSLIFAAPLGYALGLLWLSDSPELACLP